jgi:hypothetical protein
MRKILLALMLMLSVSAKSQIVIDQAGDDWQSLADSALRLIKTNSPYYYNNVVQSCDTISFFNANFSSNCGAKDTKGTIFISANDVRLGIQNIAAVIVHESIHLRITQQGIHMWYRNEERLCYTYELNFLHKLEKPEKWLIEHAETQIEKYR